MKILNLYYGLDAYDFDSTMHHADSSYSAEDGRFEEYVEKGRRAVINKKCFWFLVTETTFSPKTGETSSTHHYESVPEKAKIVLNARPKPAPKAADAPISSFWAELPKTTPMTGKEAEAIFNAFKTPVHEPVPF